MGHVSVPPADFEHVLATALLTTQFAYVYDHVAQELAFVSVGIEQLLGECPAAAEVTWHWFSARVHPADAPAVDQAQALVAEYLHARTYALLPEFLFSLDYRLRHADGTYRRVLHECMLFEREPGPGAIRRTLALFTDITHHKLSQEVRCHVNQPDFPAFAAQQRPNASVLTDRQQQILALVLQGLTSRQIAHELQLRESTVKAHRRDLLRKTGTHDLHRLFLHVNRPEFATFALQATQTSSQVLSPREQQVASLVLQGLSSARIAKELVTSIHTVNTHRRNLRRKLASTSYYTLLQQLPSSESG